MATQSARLPLRLGLLLLVVPPLLLLPLPGWVLPLVVCGMKAGGGCCRDLITPPVLLDGMLLGTAGRLPKLVGPDEAWSGPDGALPPDCCFGRFDELLSTGPAAGLLL